MPTNESPSLRDATVQEIQLELIRRSSFNAFDGEKVYASLLAHRDLWLGAILDRQGLANYDRPTRLLAMGLIKLRDLDGNFWNADKLFILTRTHAEARELARIAEEEDWSGEVYVYEDQKEIDSALGTGRQEYGLVSIWWD